MNKTTWTKLGTDTQTGVNNGVIISDEEYDGKCRVTLETCPGCHAITCSIYGSLAHTFFYGKNARAKYEEIKTTLADFLDTNPNQLAIFNFCDNFVNSF